MVFLLQEFINKLKNKTIMWYKLAGKTDQWNRSLSKSKMRSFQDTGIGTFESRLYHAAEHIKKELKLLEKNMRLETDMKEIISKELYNIFAQFRFDLDERYGKHLDRRFEFTIPSKEARNYYYSAKQWLDNQISNNWKSGGNMAWAQWSLIGKNKPQDADNNKIYFTLKDPIETENLRLFFGNLARIANDLANINTELSISFKIPEVYTSFLTHPDTLVIHFRDDDITSDVQNIVNKHLGNLKADRTQFYRVDVGRDIRGKSDTQYKCNKIADYILQYKDYFKNVSEEDFTKQLFSKWIELND